MMNFRGTSGIGRCFSDGVGHMSSYFHNGWGLVMMGVGLLIIALIIAAVVVLIKKSNRKQLVYKNDESMELLNARFVKGEITEEEYMRMKKVLSDK